jgi:hypothetical protein
LQPQSQGANSIRVSAHYRELIFHTSESFDIETFLDISNDNYITQDLTTSTTVKPAKMAPSNLPPIFNATSQDVEMLLSAQCHLGSKNLQVHMDPYLWKTRPDGINVINIGKTWYVDICLEMTKAHFYG